MVEGLMKTQMEVDGSVSIRPLVVDLLGIQSSSNEKGFDVEQEQNIEIIIIKTKTYWDLERDLFDRLCRDANRFGDLDLPDVDRSFRQERDAMVTR